jgi:hypothetical protein
MTSVHPLPMPRITQPGMVPFRKWCERYAYYIDCIQDNIRVALIATSCGGDPHMGDAMFDWHVMRSKLQVYLYRCSRNSETRFVLLV